MKQRVTAARLPRRVNIFQNTHLVLGGQGTLGTLSLTAQLGHGAAVLADVGLQAGSEVSTAPMRTEVASAKHAFAAGSLLICRQGEKAAVSTAPCCW